MNSDKILALFNGSWEDKIIGISVLCSHSREEVLDFFKKHHKLGGGVDPSNSDYWIRVGGCIPNNKQEYYRKGKDLYICIITSHIILDLEENVKNL